jgi:TolA-binding protein
MKNDNTHTRKMLQTLFALGLAGGLFLAGCADTQAERLLQKANSEWIKGHNHSAIELFKSVLEKHPTGPHAEEALFRLGEVHYFGLTDASQAVAYFLEVLLLNKQGSFSYDAQRYIAEIVEFSIKDLDQAVIEYQKLINEFGDNPEESAIYQHRIASIFSKKQNYDQAIVEWKILVDKYPKAAIAGEAQFRIAETLFTLNRCRDMPPVHQAFKLKYSGSEYNNEIDFLRASCMEEEGELKEALNLFQTLVGRYNYPPLLEMKIDSLKHRIKKVL